jgi:hypothetical protein
MSRTVLKAEISTTALVGTGGRVALGAGRIRPEIADIGHDRRGDPVLLRCGAIGQRAGANVGHLLLSQPRVPVGLTMRRSRSSPGHAIGDVVCLRPEGKVCRVATRGVVTGVAHHPAERDRPMRNGVRRPVRLLRPEVVRITGAVAKVTLAGCPGPAIVCGPLSDFGPKSINVALIHGHDCKKVGHECQ